MFAEDDECIPDFPKGLMEFGCKSWDKIPKLLNNLQIGVINPDRFKNVVCEDLTIEQHEYLIEMFKQFIAYPQFDGFSFINSWDSFLTFFLSEMNDSHSREKIAKSSAISSFHMWVIGLNMWLIHKREESQGWS